MLAAVEFTEIYMSPIVHATQRLLSVGYGPRASGYGVLHCGDRTTEERCRGLAEWLRARWLWRDAAGLEELASGLGTTEIAMALSPGNERIPGLHRAYSHYSRAVVLMSAHASEDA